MASEKMCPFTGDGCYEHKCHMYVKMMGKDPQTGKDVEEYKCSFVWLPILLIENAQQSRQTGAAVESFRNEMVKANEAMLRLSAMDKIRVPSLDALNVDEGE